MPDAEKDINIGKNIGKRDIQMKHLTQFWFEKGTKISIPHFFIENKDRKIDNNF